MVVHETRGKKLQHFYQPVLNMVWDFWKSYARTFRCLALLRWERTRDKGAMRTILGSNFILCWTLNLHWYVLFWEAAKIHKPRSLFCRKSTGVILRDAFPALQRLCANGPFEDCQVRMIVSSEHCHVLLFAKQCRKHGWSSYLPGKNIFIPK